MVSHFRYCNEIRKHNKCLFQEEEDEGEGHQKQHGRHKSNNAIIMGKVNLHYSYSPRPQRKKDVGGVRERGVVKEDNFLVYSFKGTRSRCRQYAMKRVRLLYV